MKESKKEACIVEAKTNSFEGDPDFLSINYEGEILVETCTTYMEVFYKDTNKTMNYIDVKQYYSQKGKSQIASINKNCYVKDDNNESNFILNDESETCIESTTYSTFMLE